MCYDNINKIDEGGEEMPKIVAQITDDVYKNINEEIKLGIFPNVSDAVNSALRKSYAQKSRSYLRWLMKKEGIAKAEMLKEYEKFRK